MTPAELKSARQQLGLTQAGLARLLGYRDRQHIRRMESLTRDGVPARDITPQTEIAVRYMLQYGTGVAETLANQREP